MTAANCKPKRREGGFALLIVFLMAAAVAFTLYQQLPRVAFESVREKEQLLIDRGNQYKRAIQVFYAVNKRYPAKIEDLENTNNQRYLRRRYIDPMTGKDEWRLVHTNGSALTDSLVEKPPTAGQITQNGLPGAGPLGANSMNTAAPAAAAASDAANGQAPAVNAAVAARPSDRPLGPPDQTVQNQPGQNQPGAGTPGAGFPGVPALTYDPSDPRTWPAITIATANPQTGAQNGANTTGNPANTTANSAGGFPAPGQGQGQANANANGGQQVALTPGGGFNGQQGGQGGQNPQQINLNGAGNPVNGGPAPTAFQSPFADGSPNPALGLINTQLTQSAPTVAPSTGTQNQPPSQTPAQTPSLTSGLTSAIQNLFPGTSSTSNNSTSASSPATTNSAGTGGATGGALGGTTGGPGIAGVASTHQGPSIKSYKERLKYQEWEFVYEPSQQTATQSTQTTQPGQPGQPTQPASPFAPTPATGMGGQTPSATPPQSSPFGLPAQVQ